MDPGTALAVVSLALQVSSGLIDYYRLWRDCQQDVEGLRASLVRLERIFKPLEQVLKHPDSNAQIVATICSICKDCEHHVDELRSILEKVKEDGNPKSMLQRLKDKGRRACYPFRKSTITRLAEIIEDLKEDIGLSVQVLSLDTGTETHSTLKRVQEDFMAMKETVDHIKEDVHSSVENQNQSKVFEWLDAPDHSSAHNLACEKCYAGTGGWFIESEVFKSWFSQKRSKLWLYGNSGSGKTILCSTIIETIRQLTTEKEDYRGGHLAYFYFSFDTAENHNLTSVLKSLIAQLCRPEKFSVELGRFYKDNYPEAPSQKRLVSLLLSILRRLGGRPNEPLGFSRAAEETFLVFDGIDEIPYGSDREAIFSLLQDISAISTTDHIHMILTSRNEMEIARSLSSSQGWLRHGMFRSRIQKDIAAYTSSQIATHPRLNALPMETKLKIRETLVEGSNGMFRWAALQMDYLKRLRIIRPHDVLRVLNTLPHDLSGTYDRILQRIDPLYAEEALNALQWILFAARPLFLEEVAEACIVDPNSLHAVDPLRKMGILDIADILNGLVVIEPAVEESAEVTPGGHVLALAHFSVKEYLTSAQTRGLPNGFDPSIFEAGLAHCYILKSCMAYIRWCALQTNPGIEHHMMLQSYACNRWPFHASQLDKSNHSEGIEAAAAVFTVSHSCKYWIERSRVYWHDNLDFRLLTDHYQNLTSRYYADVALNEEDMTCVYPLYHSIVFRLEGLSQFLLAQLSGDLVDAKGTYLLEVAVISHTTSIIEPLIRVGAKPGGALIIALSTGNDEASSELLRVGCEPQNRDLIVAAVRCSETVMETLMDRLMTKLGVDDRVTVVMALDGGLRSHKLSNANAIIKALTASYDGADNTNNLSLERLLSTAVTLDFSIVVAELMKWEKHFQQADWSYDDLFRRSAKMGSIRSAKVLLNSHAKSRIKHATFSRVLFSLLSRYCSDSRNFLALPGGDNSHFPDTPSRLHFDYHSFFRVLIPHIRTDKHSRGALRLCLATTDDQTVARFLTRNAETLRTPRKCIDYLAFLMAGVRNFQSTVTAMQHIGAKSKILRMLESGSTIRDIAEILCLFGAPPMLDRNRLFWVPLHSPTLQAEHLVQVAQKAVQDMTSVSQVMTNYHQKIQWSLRRVNEITDRVFKITDGRSWFLGSDEASDLDISLVDGRLEQSLSASASYSIADIPVLTVHRYVSSITGIETMIYCDDIPMTPWIGRVYDIVLINQDESSWETALDQLEPIRASIHMAEFSLDYLPSSAIANYSEGNLTSSFNSWSGVLEDLQLLWQDLGMYTGGYLQGVTWESLISFDVGHGMLAYDITRPQLLLESIVVDEEEVEENETLNNLMDTS